MVGFFVCFWFGLFCVFVVVVLVWLVGFVAVIVALFCFVFNKRKYKHF